MSQTCCHLLYNIEKNLSLLFIRDIPLRARKMIGKYERGEAVPSNDAAKKIADAFEVSLDYLVGEDVNASFDKNNLKCLQDIEKLDSDVKDKLYFVIDNIIQNTKAKKALAS
jgi:transcriptional regulator with XRE-family HTH domain